MKKSIILVCLATIVIVSCQHFSYSDTKTLNGGAWNRFEPIAFEFDITKPDQATDIWLIATFDTAIYRAAKLPLVVKMIGTNGERRQFRSEIVVVDKKGQLCGEVTPSGLIECRQKIRNNFYFNTKGQHRMEVSQGTTKYDIRGIGEIGLHLEKSKSE